MPSSGKRFFNSRTARGTSPAGLVASRPSGVFSDGSITGNSAITGMPSATHSSAVAYRRSMLRRCTPGMLGTSCACCVPSSTNTGRIRSCGARRCSRTSARVKASRRRRRGRLAGKGGGVCKAGILCSVAAAAPAGRPCNRALTGHRQPGKTALPQKLWPLLESKMNDSRKAFIPCFSSLSRCLSVLTAIRLVGPGLAPGPFSWRRCGRGRP